VRGGGGWPRKEGAFGTIKTRDGRIMDEGVVRKSGFRKGGKAVSSRKTIPQPVEKPEILRKEEIVRRKVKSTNLW